MAGWMPAVVPRPGLHGVDPKADGGVQTTPKPWHDCQAANRAQAHTLQTVTAILPPLFDLPESDPSQVRFTS